MIWLYALIGLPFLGWLIAFGFDGWIAFNNFRTNSFSKKLGRTHASWGITHTLLIYSFTVFMISHADVLPKIDVLLFLPICLFLVSAIMRGCLYLYLFYGDRPAHFKAGYGLFALTHMISLGSILAGAWIVVNEVTRLNFVPDTSYLPVITIGLIITSLVCMVPIYAAYRATD